MKKRTPKLGQHFLKARWAARALARAAAIVPEESVLEIGPGKGALTKELLLAGASAIAIEKDPALIEKLRETFGNEIRSGALALIETDVRNIAPETLGLVRGSYVVAANIPYYITGEIIRQFLTSDVQPRAMALLVQKEVADRITARDHKESILSLSVKAYGRPKIIAKVSRGNFSPPPSVDSAILLIDHISKDFFKDLGEEKFFETIRAGFASKRKMLIGNLKKRFGDNPAFKNLPGNIRAEDVDLETWKALAENLS